MLCYEPGPHGTLKSNKTIKYYIGAIRTKDRYYRTWARASWTIQKLHEILFFKYIYRFKDSNPIGDYNNNKKGTFDKKSKKFIIVLISGE